MTFSLLQLLLAALLSGLSVFWGYRRYALKAGCLLRGDYTTTSSIACEDVYISRVTIENLKDRAVTIFAIYVKIGRNHYMAIEEFEEKPLILKGFETFQQDYGPIEFYSTGTSRIKLDKLIQDRRTRKQLVLSTSEGKYVLKSGLPRWSPVYEFFRNYMTGIVHPVRSIYKGQAYGGNTRFLVELILENGAEQVMPIYPRDHEVRRFRRFALTPESLESKEALQTLLNREKEAGNLPVNEVRVHDFPTLRGDHLAEQRSKTVQAHAASAIEYHVLGYLYTRFTNWKTRRQNKLRARKGQQPSAGDVATRAAPEK